MSHRATVNVSDLTDLLSYAKHSDAAVILNCDAIKKGAIIVLATEKNAELFLKVITDSELFEKYASEHVDDVPSVIRALSSESDCVMFFDTKHLMNNSIVVAANGVAAGRIKQAMEKAR